MKRHYVFAKNIFCLATKTTVFSSHMNGQEWNVVIFQQMGQIHKQALEKCKC